jgi:large subunit ribosomal protein LP0
MPGGEAAERKQAYFTKLAKLLDEYPKILLVIADNVGSNQMQKIRQALRGKAVLLMGKNTMIRKAMRSHAQQNPSIEVLLPYVRGNVGFIFTKEDLSEVRNIVTANKVSAPARAGSIAPCDVTIPAGNTGMEPTQTSFFQALNIPTKISKGTIEILSDQVIIRQGEKVGNSEAVLLQRLNIKPFSYGLVPTTVYDEGSVYAARVLDLSADDIVAKFHKGVKNIACIGLKIGYPTIASVPHSIARGYKNIMALSLAADIPCKATEQIKAYLENPSAFAAPAAAATPAPAAEAKEEKKEEPKEESDEDMGFGLFD